MESIKHIIASNFDKYRQTVCKKRGFTKVPNIFIENNSFSIYEKMVGIVITKHQMNRRLAWPSQRRIALQAGCSVSTVKKAINGLQSKHVLAKKTKAKGTNNLYQINIDLTKL